MNVGLQELDLDEANLIPSHLLAELRQETQELIAIFVTIINKAKTN